MPCNFCERDKTIAARGMCRACYSRWQRAGTAEYQRKGKYSLCHLNGCKKRAVSHGMCDMHRRRMERHGHIEETRPDDWGVKHRHPLYNSWAWLRRHKSHTPVCAEWLNDFLQFAMDVGDRPSKKHKLYVADDSKLIGPGNFVWKRAVTERVEGEDDRTYRARQQRVYRAVRNEEFKGYDLKKLYGMSLAEYETLHRAQDGKCAVCGEEEGLVIRGKKVSLAVDHCHETSRIRGLLCSQCNRGIGLFRDSPDLLEKAAGYLRTG